MVDPRAQADDDTLVALMSDYQGGSLAAFEQLHAALAPLLRGWFQAQLRQHAAAADLVQDTFLELHRARRTYQPGRPVRAWAFGIARHVLLRHRDDERRRTRHEAALAHDQLPLLEAAAGVDVLVADARLVDGALRALSPGTREAWWLHHVEGVAFDEIARRLDIAATAARLRASRATAAIRRALGPERGQADG